MILKKDVRIKFQRPDDIHVFGYCSDEIARFDKFLDANNIDARSPLIDRNLTHSDTLAMLQHEGITLPTMYQLGYKHNNCIGCVKSSGAGYWNKIRDDFPRQFNHMATLSRVLGVRIIQVGKSRVYLDELAKGTGRYQDEPEVQCGIFCEMSEWEYK